MIYLVAQANTDSASRLISCILSGLANEVVAAEIIGSCLSKFLLQPSFGEGSSFCNDKEPPSCFKLVCLDIRSAISISTHQPNYIHW